MPLYTVFQLDEQTESTSTAAAISEFFDAQQTIQFVGHTQYTDAENQLHSYGLLLERTAISADGKPDAYFVNEEDADVTESAIYALNNLYPTNTAGWAQTNAIPNRTPIMWQENAVIFLHTLGGESGEAHDINDANQLVGWAQDANGNRRAFFWMSGANHGPAVNPQMMDLGTLGGANSEATAMNNAGQVVGWAEIADGTRHAFLWTPGAADGIPGNPQMKDLHPAGFNESVANDINEAGHVVGDMYNGPHQPFYWSAAGGLLALPTLGYSAAALAINAGDIIVGTSMAAPGSDPGAVCWTNFLIASLSGLAFGAHHWRLQTATGINAQGDIVCNGLVAPGYDQAHGIYLTPFVFVPPRLPLTVKIPPLRYFNWLAYHFWWHYPKEFSAVERRTMQEWLTENGWDNNSKPERVFAAEGLAGRLESFGLLIKNKELRSRIQSAADRYEKLL